MSLSLTFLFCLLQCTDPSSLHVVPPQLKSLIYHAPVNISIKGPNSDSSGETIETRSGYTIVPAVLINHVHIGENLKLHISGSKMRRALPSIRSQWRSADPLCQSYRPLKLCTEQPCGNIIWYSLHPISHGICSRTP